MTAAASRYCTVRLEAGDVSAGLRSGRHPLDDYFARHAMPNDAAGISRAFVLRRSDDDAGLPTVLGFYTLSMSSAAAADLAPTLTQRLPKYPLPVALIGRLAVDERVQGRRLGERLLLDALRRVLDAAELVACLGIIVDAKDDNAAKFYAKYGFVVLSAAGWPQRMFLALATAREAFAEK
jgi:ribosomal protein S18 acetylase RimI-like enzyme